MIYSTCTFNIHENEENVRWITEQTGATIVEIPTLPDWGITGSLLEGFDAPVCRFIPGLTRSEGLFVAVLRKPDGETSFQSKGLDSSLSRLTVLHSSVSPAWRTVVSGRHGGLPLQGVKEGRHGGLPQQGMKAGRHEALPSPAEPLSVDLDKGKYPMVQLPYATAIDYLRRQAIVLSADTPKGLVVVGYEGHPLGFVKNIGSRANNLYPQQWAIRSTHTPNEPR